MRRGPAARWLIALMIVAAVPISGARPAAAAGTPRPDHLLIRLWSGALIVRIVPAGRGPATVSRLRRDPDVRSVIVERLSFHEADVPNDPCLTTCGGVTQWAPAKIHAFDAWSVTHGSPTVRVAVLDTGVSGTGDLTGKVDLGGNYSDSSTTNDVRGHGTHVAGIIAADTGNGVDVAGIGYLTRVLSIKVLGDDGTGFPDAIASGIDEAIAAHVQVLNLSLAGNDDGGVVGDAISRAERAGVLVVAAAGNELSTEPDFPASHPGVIGVAASGQDDRLPASFSRRGTWVDAEAPGVGIVSTVPSGRGVASGTSMAAAHVSGVAALVFGASPGITAAAVRARLGRGAADVVGSGTDSSWGRIDALGALQPPRPAYRLLAGDGGVFTYGTPFLGADPEPSSTAPEVVGSAGAPSGRGYWIVRANGAITGFGDAPFTGDLLGLRLNRPIVGLTPTALGAGYWVVASDGGVFSFGDAEFHGSTGSLSLNKPIVGMAPTPGGHGYWLVASDGGVFAFGDAGFFGSTGSFVLNKPVVGMSPSPTGRGYWLVASDGGIFAFGDAAFYGSTGSLHLNRPVVGMAASPAGYWLVASDGGIFAYGDAAFLGSTGGMRLDQPIVGMVA